MANLAEEATTSPAVEEVVVGKQPRLGAFTAYTFATSISNGAERIWTDRQTDDKNEKDTKRSNK